MNLITTPKNTAKVLPISVGAFTITYGLPGRFLKSKRLLIIAFKKLPDNCMPYGFCIVHHSIGKIG